MITTAGRQNLIRLAGGLQSSLVTSIAIGAGNTAAAVGDTRLDYETLRLPVLSATPDYVNNAIIFKATVPAEESRDIFEIGLVSSRDSGIKIVSDFTEEAGFWTTGSISTLNSRVSGGTLLLAPAASATATSTANVGVEWADADEVVVSYFVGPNVSSLTIRFSTDGANYYSYSLPVAAGYRITRIPRASFSTTGGPTTLNSISLIAVATSGGTAAVYLDSISSVDTTDAAPELIARRVLPANILKAFGTSRDIEYSLSVAAV